MTMVSARIQPDRAQLSYVFSRQSLVEAKGLGVAFRQGPAGRGRCWTIFGEFST
jgi:hypothetical protein